MNLSTKRAVPGIQARICEMNLHSKLCAEKRETNEGRQKETNELNGKESRARYPGWVTSGDK